MADEAVEVKEIPIDSEEVSMQEYKKARSEGVLTIEKPVEPTEEEIEKKEPETTEETTEETKPDDKPKGKNAVQRRIDQLTREKKEEREAKEKERKEKEAIAREFEEFKAGHIKQEPVEPTKVLANGRPVWDGSQPIEDFIVTMNEWIENDKKRAAEEQKASEAKQRNAEREKELKALQESSIDEVAERNKEFSDWMKSSEWPNTHEDSAEAYNNFVLALRASKLAGPIMEYYYENPEEFSELHSMPPEEVVIEVAGVVRQIKKGQKSEDKPVKIVSKSAPPIKPVSGGNTKSSVPLGEMDMAAYRKARAAGRIR